ncbi:MAG: glycosyltransferase [Anaerolineae bacterium]|nr:glycosyltransferase [Gemmatimonadaceae bacterium]
MTGLALSLIAAPVLLFGYAYAGYPLLLRLLVIRRPEPRAFADPVEWPGITIVVPCFNEEKRIRSTLESILTIDYPAASLQVLVVSDASFDGTDAIVAEYARFGVELLRLPVRRGKTAAENIALESARGDIVVNLDASVRILPSSVKALVRAFQDPSVGVVSSRDVSTGSSPIEGNQGESGYVGYEMWVREQETRMGSIVGASGSFFGIRRGIHEPAFPDALSRDFASALMAREQGYRSVSARDVVCLVPRTSSLHVEFRRKIRTMARGLETLWYKRQMMNPMRYGSFAWMLISHKLCRWLAYLTLPLGFGGLLLLALEWRIALVLLAITISGIAAGVIGMCWPQGRAVPTIFAVPGFALASNLAGVLAWVKVFRGKRSPIWEPTRR